MIRVRFAPSPTGELHIGSARTALFNWLYARHVQGKFFLRIEDTDLARSTPENTQAIFDALKFLEIDFDEKPVIQSKRLKRHQEVAYEMLHNKTAYKCYCSKEELEVIRAKEGRYSGICRNKGDLNQPYVVRLKSDDTGSITIHDGVQGEITVKGEVLDDMVLLRQDGSPTYMLSVVVDDHDMEITHIIRGDDHLTNAFRQYQIYKAMGWNIPHFYHIPLIHGSQGGKLSKREGAISIQSFQKEGILSEALFNYLLRLGWSHGNDEIISRDQAVKWFDINDLGQSPSRFDKDKLLFLNAHYIKNKDNNELFQLMEMSVSDVEKKRILKGLTNLKIRAKTLVELKQNAEIYLDKPIVMTLEALAFEYDKALVTQYIQALEKWDNDFTEHNLMMHAKEFAINQNIKLVALAQPLRILITGSLVSPSVFEIMEILGKENTLKRLTNFEN